MTEAQKEHLRDKFALRAMIVALTNCVPGKTYEYAFIAELSYSMADAMIARRDKSKEGV